MWIVFFFKEKTTPKHLKIIRSFDPRVLLYVICRKEFEGAFTLIQIFMPSQFFQHISNIISQYKKFDFQWRSCLILYKYKNLYRIVKFKYLKNEKSFLCEINFFPRFQKNSYLELYNQIINLYRTCSVVVVAVVVSKQKNIIKAE